MLNAGEQWAAPKSGGFTALAVPSLPHVLRHGVPISPIRSERQKNKSYKTSKTWDRG